MTFFYDQITKLFAIIMQEKGKFSVKIYPFQMN